MDKPHELPAYIAVDLIRQGKLKPSGLMQAYAEQISQLEPKVGAFTHLDLDSAMRRAKVLDSEPAVGLLFGIPLGVKDLMDTADMPTSYGSPIYRHHCPASDAACLTEVKSQGGVIMGKTVTTEFAIFHPGKTANPHNVAHTPGGSSSGSAAAVAAHMVPLAFGTQTAASVYRPASFCGVVGYKPSYGLIQRGGVKTLSESFDTVGLIANCVMDVALLAAAASRRPHLLPSSNRVGAAKPTVGLFRTPHWEMAEQASQAAVLGFADRLSTRGVSVIDIDAPAIFNQLLQAQTDVMLAEAAIALGYEYVHHKALCSPKLIEVIEQGNAIRFDRLQAANETIRQARAAIRDIFRGVDVLLSPAAVGEAPEGLHATGDPVFGRAWTALRTPGLTIPGATGPKGLPIGVLLSGAQDNDAQFLLAAHVLEQLGKP